MFANSGEYFSFEAIDELPDGFEKEADSGSIVSKTEAVSESDTMPYAYHRNAVSIKNAGKEYPSKRGTTAVLKNFNMTVKQGTM
jgi:ABC-type transport system involved in cytochrome bd biosynthesis fused ATPase/permease subunit